MSAFAVPTTVPAVATVVASKPPRTDSARIALFGFGTVGSALATTRLAMRMGMRGMICEIREDARAGNGHSARTVCEKGCEHGRG